MGMYPQFWYTQLNGIYTYIMYAHDSQHILCTHFCFTALFIMDTLPVKGIVGAQLFCDFQTH